jgi:hypothetical protein
VPWGNLLISVFKLDPPGFRTYGIGAVLNLFMPVLEFIDPVFVKTSPKPSFSMSENGRFGLVFVKTGSINLGKDQ